MTLIESNSQQKTFQTGREFAKTLSAGEVVGLSGELGSGKTVFVKGVCDYFNVKDDVNSPTFIIVNQYEGVNPETSANIQINHFDLYRINNESELYNIDMFSFINENSICLVEWCEIASKILPDMKLIKLKHAVGENNRTIEI